jgi:hypothetical protein
MSIFYVDMKKISVILAMRHLMYEENNEKEERKSCGKQKKTIRQYHHGENNISSANVSS